MINSHLAIAVCSWLPFPRLPRCQSPLPPTRPADSGEWIQLFNGKDLTGWTPKIVGHAAGDNYADTFRVKDGVLAVSYDNYDGPFNDRFGHLFYKEPFSNYILRLEYRVVGEQIPAVPTGRCANSGVMIHGQTPESMGRDQNFPVSIEVQLLAGEGDETRPHRQRLHARHAHRARRQAPHAPLHQQHEQDLSRRRMGRPSKSKSTATS